MKKLSPLLTILIVSAFYILGSPVAYAAIAFDATADGGGFINSTTNTYAITIGTGFNRLLVVEAWSTKTGTNGITGITYNGIALTRIDEQLESGQGCYVSLWYLLDPVSGTNNIIVSGTQNGIISTASSYSGVKQSAPENYVKGEAMNSLTLSLTTVSNNCWTVMGIRCLVSAPSAGTGSTQRQSTPAGSGIFDSNGPKTPAGSTSMQVTGSDRVAGIMASFAPYAPPVISSINPNTGFNDASVSIASIGGAGFVSGCSVKLVKIGQGDINCTGFTFTNSSTLSNGSCLITGAATGAWDVVVTNPDAQTGALANGFNIYAPPVAAPVDWNNGNVQEITLSPSRSFTFANGKSGAAYTLLINQGATGGWIVTWPANVKWATGTAPILTTAANAVALIKFMYNGTHYLENGIYQY